MNISIRSLVRLALATAVLLSSPPPGRAETGDAATQVLYRTVKIAGLDIF